MAACVIGLLGLAAGGLPAAGANPTALPSGGFLAGAAKIDITPPRFDRTVDATAFPVCPSSVFSGHRTFAFEEPYVDFQGLGHFAYPDPFCDGNGNGRYDGVYLSGSVGTLATGVHDPIDARALALSDGRATAVILSVTSLGLFENYAKRVRAQAQSVRPGISDVIVSANHNESSPDPVGIYGAPSSGQGFGLRSGIDDYYMDWLVNRLAQVAVAAYDNRRPATLAATQYRLPPRVHIRLSDNFPTTGPSATPAAVDPKVGLLVARDRHGAAIATVMSLAAHNQEIGHSSDAGTSSQISADWPGAFARRVETQVGGTAMFLVGDNGSIEDPETVPQVPASAGPGCPDGCFAQAAATGAALADAAVAARRDVTPIRPGRVIVRRDQFPVPLENNLFKAADAAGLFGARRGYVGALALPPGIPAPDFVTSVAVADIGPDLQLLANPGESFPALMVGAPWGRSDASCPDRPNPPVPAWHARARWRFQVGLADDMTGYLLPPWGFATQPGIYLTTCTTDANDRDQRGHQHKLEDESVGPTAGALVAEHLVSLLTSDPLGPGPGVVEPGRFMRADGSLARSPLGAVAVRLTDGVVLRGQFIDYDGARQGTPDITTRGIVAQGRTIYVDVYPDAA